MFNQDNVIRYAIEARNAHAYEVGKALASYVAEQTPETRAALRIALVAMSLGHEISAHDGSTREARVAAAQRALEAWDGLPSFDTGPSSEVES